MKKYIWLGMLVLLLVFPISGWGQDSSWQPGPVDKTARCPVCGMFVHKYEQWIGRLLLSDGSDQAFDGVKDMMAYYFSPQQFGAKAGVTVTAVRVKDYYTLQWLDGKSAFYVLGSDVLGPMGHELIPFATREAAENFLADHKGKEILAFPALSPELIAVLREGHMMMHKHSQMK
jgi:copper chaperone NosL